LPVLVLPSPDELHRRIASLRDAVRAEAAAIFALWRDTIADRHFLPAAHNLAAYLALRHHDISDLQPALAAYGVSSLGRSEAHVLASLDALCATLACIAGASEHAYPPPGRMAAGEAALRRAQTLLFGRDVVGARTRIMITLPSQAATDRALVRALITAGMTCARINCAHDDEATWRAMAEMVRGQAAAAGQDCRVLMDIGGPKCRVETVHAADKVRLFRGNRIVMVRDLAQASVADAIISTISFPEILADLTPGKEVWINDGKIGLRVVAAAEGRVELEVFSARAKGERLRPEKGVNFPGTELHLCPLAGKDLADLDVIAGLADIVGFSFVQRPEDLVLLRQELARRGADAAMPVVLKIETPLAVRNLPRLIVQAAAAGPLAVMIARGDLAVELGFARMTEIQEEIMWLCEAAHVPVVWATQVLEGLVSDGIPSRAEATDAAMAQRAECVMLNKGPFLPEAARFLADVLRRMDRHQAKKSARFGPLHSWPPDELGFMDPS
jgi:pyruvate kinase